MTTTDDPLIRAEGLEKRYTTADGFSINCSGGAKTVRAVDGVDLEIRTGETLGLVGESGCGKTTLGRALVRLLEPTAGSITYRDTELTECSRSELRALRSEIQYVFQDPLASLNPQLTVADIVGEALAVHDVVPPEHRDERVRELLETVGLQANHASRYPHEFSGGQRQRIGIARALAVEPEFVVCDEPVSSLDVSVQAGILNLLSDLQEEFGLSYLIITHDLSVVEHIADRVAVMYLGELVKPGRPPRSSTHPLIPTPKRCCRRSPNPTPAGRAIGSSSRGSSLPTDPRRAADFTRAVHGSSCPPNITSRRTPSARSWRFERGSPRWTPTQDSRRSSRAPTPAGMPLRRSGTPTGSPPALRSGRGGGSRGRARGRRGRRFRGRTGSARIGVRDALRDD